MTGRFPRVVGRTTGDIAGPTLICVAGLHGNEPAGVDALRRLFSHLDASEIEVRGSVTGLLGNRVALTRGKRYVDRDLNRGWRPETIEALRGKGPGRAMLVEDREQLALLEEFDRAVGAAEGPIFVLDLHTTSGPGPPFATLGDTPANRAFAARFPIPAIVGLQNSLAHVFLDYIGADGNTTMAVEGGGHYLRESVDRLAAILRIAAVEAGVVIGDDIAPARELLRAAAADHPSLLEVRYRHAIRPVDRFRMLPGYANLQPVAEGEVLARDRHGPVHAPESGRILMPLYQERGNDGFFVAGETSPVRS